jgi:hypothetical protein
MTIRVTFDLVIDHVGKVKKPQGISVKELGWGESGEVPQGEKSLVFQKFLLFYGIIFFFLLSPHKKEGLRKYL